MNNHPASEKPSQLELANLAASVRIDGEGYEVSVERALELWKAAGEALNPPPPLPAKRRDLPYEEFLRELFPKRSKEYRVKKFRDYLRWFAIENAASLIYEQRYDPKYKVVLAHRVKITEKRILDAVGILMRRHKEDGIGDPDKLKAEFEKWMKSAHKTKSVGPNKVG